MSEPEPTGASRVALAVVAASALVVSAAVWLPLADVWFFSLDSGEELARAELKIAPEYAGWPFYVFGGVLIAGLATTLAIRDGATRRGAVIVAIGWLWFSAAGLSMVLTVPNGIDPPAGTCYGLPVDPADYWGAESWQQIEPAYEAAAAREPAGGVCFDRQQGPAAPLTILACLVGVTASGIALAKLRRRRRVALAALGAALPPAVLWLVAGFLEALSTLE